MQTIYKYPLQIADKQVIKMPAGANILHAGLDPRGVPCLWAQVNEQAELVPVSIFIYGTGVPILQKSLLYVGSFTQCLFVWHVFRS